MVPLGQTVIWSLGTNRHSSPTAAHLWPQCRDIEEVHVAQVGEADQRVLAVVLLRRGAEDHQRHLPHPAALVRRQLELGLGAHLRQREHLCRRQSALASVLSVYLDLVQRRVEGCARPSAAPPRR